jgi:hypothetical protein
MARTVIVILEEYVVRSLFNNESRAESIWCRVVDWLMNDWLIIEALYASVCGLLKKISAVAFRDRENI